MQLWNRYVVFPDQSIFDIPSDIQHIYIYGFEGCRDVKLILSPNSFHRLKSIIIGKNGFQYVREFVVDGLERLESVKIREKCFGVYNGVCRITNCPNLCQLEIGGYSFWDFKSFELSNLNSLQSIKFGHYCFYYADFSLNGK